jgi:hypothetical protein
VDDDGRRSAADATIFTLTPLFIWFPIIPLLAGYFETWKRAAGTALIASILSYILVLLSDVQEAQPLANWMIPQKLSPLADNAHIADSVIALATNPLFWITMPCWVLSAIVMSFLCSRNSRLVHSLGIILASCIVSLSSILAPELLHKAKINISFGAGIWNFHSTPYVDLGTSLNIIPVIISLAVAMILVIFGVQTQPFNNRDIVKGKK